MGTVLVEKRKSRGAGKAFKVERTTINTGQRFQRSGKAATTVRVTGNRVVHDTRLPHWKS